MTISNEDMIVLGNKLHDDWMLSDDNKSITRSIKFKSYSATARYVTTIAEMAMQERHHPDIGFGYGKFDITYSTHDADGLTKKDFICAELADSLLLNN